jgi:hypothetical protein
LLGFLLTGTAAFAAGNWLVGLNGGSSGEAKAGAVSNLTVTATASQTPANLLFPGGTGDVVVNIANPNAFPVSITGFNVPTNTTYAVGYTDSGLGTADTDCTGGAGAAPSLVTYTGATGTSGSVHTLGSTLVVAANGSLVATLTRAATMDANSPNGCQNTYFSMPSFTGIAATAGGSPVTAPNATVTWS